MTNNLDYPNAGSPVVYLGPSRTYMELYISSDNAAWISCNTDGAFEVIASITYRTA
jgi:hypothetical protein